MKTSGETQWTLTKKFLVSIQLALLLVFTVMGVIISMHEKNVLNIELRQKGANVAKFLSAISAEPILSFNLSYLENHVRYVSASDKDIVSVVIEDKDGKPLTSQQNESANKEDVLEFTSPIMQGNEPIGLVKIGYSAAQIKNTTVTKDSPGCFNRNDASYFLHYLFSFPVPCCPAHQTFERRCRTDRFRRLVPLHNGRFK